MNNRDEEWNLISSELKEMDCGKIDCEKLYERIYFDEVLLVKEESGHKKEAPRQRRFCNVKDYDFRSAEVSLTAS
ncbi:Hypothetical predicted protein [Octopus vulgaris]|uniref:Uncharacterized protein n=1 Tax=Octopus vulgaris TaxID=6645 RepID=A0AA36AJG6_OCTVU|nr:Hypothetical predicted protein [Octopus vulgaris]